VAALVLFDGVCNLCVGSVHFILRHEAGPEIQFAPLQSATGTRMVRELGFDPTDAKTFVLVEAGHAYVRSAAAIRVARYLRWPWRALAAVWIVPRPVRDWAYSLVTANRYRWFGRTDTCMVPTPELKRRFTQD
jgi:predicted DCC family thiol-disulfide oxidoreductase YuxK